VPLYWPGLHRPFTCVCSTLSPANIFFVGLLVGVPRSVSSPPCPINVPYPSSPCRSASFSSVHPLSPWLFLNPSVHCPHILTQREFIGTCKAPRMLFSPLCSCVTMFLSSGVCLPAFPLLDSVFFCSSPLEYNAISLSPVPPKRVQVFPLLISQMFLPSALSPYALFSVMICTRHCPPAPSLSPIPAPPHLSNDHL